MKNIPNKTHDPYVTFLKKHEIPSREIPFYLQWATLLPGISAINIHIPHLHPIAKLYFIKKLGQKNQTGQQIGQAKQLSFYSIN